MRLKLIACEIIYRGCLAAVARSVNQVDVEFLPKGLHDIGQAGMSARLAEARPPSMSRSTRPCSSATPCAATVWSG